MFTFVEPHPADSSRNKQLCFAHTATFDSQPRRAAHSRCSSEYHSNSQLQRESHYCDVYITPYEVLTAWICPCGCWPTSTPTERQYFDWGKSEKGVQYSMILHPRALNRAHKDIKEDSRFLRSVQPLRGTTGHHFEPRGPPCLGVCVLCIVPKYHSEARKEACNGNRSKRTNQNELQLCQTDNLKIPTSISYFFIPVSQDN